MRERKRLDDEEKYGKFVMPKDAPYEEFSTSKLRELREITKTIPFNYKIVNYWGESQAYLRYKSK